MNKKVITACAVGVLLVVALCFGIYNLTIKEQPMPITDASASTLPEELSSSSVPDIPAIVVPSSSIAPIVAASSSSVAEPAPEAKPAPQPSVITSTPNNNGGKDYNVSRPEYSQPPEDETIYDEPEDNGNGTDNGNGGGSNTPDGSGQQGDKDKPQGGGNNGGTNTPGGNGGNGSGDKPQGGGNQGGGKPGQIYVPGFGWMDDKPSTGSGEIAENAGTGEVIGE